MPPSRKTRKSGTATPHATDTASPASENRPEKTQRSLDSWVEPTPKNPEPSFQEQGYSRAGVVEGMAALGVPPNSRVKARTQAMPEAATRRSLGGNARTHLAAEGAVSTPEMTPAPELDTPADSRAEEDDEEDEMAVPLPPAAHEEDDDDDYVPTKGKNKVGPSPRGRPPKLAHPAGQAPTNPTTDTNISPAKDTTSRPSTAVTTTIPPQEIPHEMLMSNSTVQRMTIAVNEATLQSRAVGRPHIGDALGRINREAAGDEYRRQLFIRVMYGIPADDPKVLMDFRRMIAEKKLEIKREQREQKARLAAEQNSSATPPAASMSPSSAAPAKATNGVSPLTSADPVGASATGPAEVLPSLAQEDVTMEDAPPVMDSGAVSPDSEDATPHPLASVPDLANHSTSPHRGRMTSRSPRKRAQVNGAAESEKTTGAAGEPSTKRSSRSSPPAESPDSIIGGAASDSDLSDVNEEIVQQGPPEPLQPKSTSATPAPQVPKKTKVTGVRNAGKKSRASSVKLNGKYEKKAPPTVVDLAEQEMLRHRRMQLATAQPYNTLQDFPMSTSRFEDDLMETESLTSSQIAVGPPNDSAQHHFSQPRRSGQTITIPRRFHDDNSAFPSSQPDSAVSTRPTTPVIAPPAKRVKLNNGQAARTKRSPTKNRDGPIAGIPHGGAARQLGPDDNDPELPPSESDDFCSACKGPGEFVCCDHCTRVYHFLCCDPPRQKPPEGSFSCHECDAKSRAAEESPLVDHFVSFGPLLRQLDATNTRSFALPFEIRDYFDGVAARDDGSYGEPVKKYPLSKSSGYGYQRPEYLKTHDADHKPILCCQCGKSATGKRQMLKCDFCNAYWHLDCCDPPLANPPPVNLESANRDAWKCPRHIDHDFRSGLLRQQDLNDGFVDDDDVDMFDASSSVSHQQVTRKVRKPKKSHVVQPLFSRGLRNNGFIDIVNDSDDETDGEGNYVFEDQNSKTFRIPEKGIVLDFISKVKDERAQRKLQERKAARAAARKAAKQRAERQRFASRSIADQQTALYLAKFAGKEKDIGLDQVSVDALCLNLTAEAPKDVVTAINSAAPGPMTDDMRKQMLKLRELLDKALAGGANGA